MKRAALVVALMVAVAAGWAVWHRRAARSIDVRFASCRGCNVLLVTIDTLRRDRVGAFGGSGNLTPTIDRLASEGIRIDRAYASAPLTLPSHTSIMTAVEPPVHGVRTNGLFRLGPALPTLATVLKNAGYRTGAFVGAFVLDARFGLNRGFDVYDDRYGEKHASDVTEGAERRAEDVIKPAAAWILNQPPRPNPSNTPNPESRIPNPDRGAQPSTADRRPPTADQRPWFAWVHLYDPHEPYDAPAEYTNGRTPYDAEVAYADAMLGRFLADLQSAGQLDRTLVIVAADHGESLGEHDERTHGVFVYDETMRVPWVIWAGARIGGGAFDGLARLIDLAPTALDLVGVASPGSFDGRSLVPAMTGAEPPPATAYLEAMDANLTRNWAPLTAIVNGDDKLIDLPLPELYDLRVDPGEATNLVVRSSERARTLTALLAAENRQFETHASGSAEKTTLNAESRQRLQALGYVATSADPKQRVYTDADDPKRLIGVSNELNQALGDFKRGAREQGMAEASRIVVAYPTFATAYGVFASMQHDTGDLPGATRTLETMVQRGMADQSVMVVLAGYLQEAGALDKAAGLLQAVVDSHPDYADAWNSLGVVLSRKGDHGRARAAFAKVLQLDPTSATAYENLGVDDLAAGSMSAAETDLRRAIELDPRLANAHNALATVYMRQRRLPDAVAEWRVALELDPRLYDALYNLGTSLWDAGQRNEATPYLERFVREAPMQRYGADVTKIRKMLTGGN